LFYEDKAKPEQFYSVYTTEDERFAIMAMGARVRRGTRSSFAISRRATKVYRVVPEISDDSFQVVDNLATNS